MSASPTKEAIHILPCTTPHYRISITFSIAASHARDEVRSSSIARSRTWASVSVRTRTHRTCLVQRRFSALCTERKYGVGKITIEEANKMTRRRDRTIING